MVQYLRFRILKFPLIVEYIYIYMCVCTYGLGTTDLAFFQLPVMFERLNNNLAKLQMLSGDMASWATITCKWEFFLPQIW